MCIRDSNHTYTTAGTYTATIVTSDPCPSGQAGTVTLCQRAVLGSVTVTVTGGPLTATLSCQPQTADVGMSLAISYSCSAGIASGTGWTVTTQPSGSATTTVAAPPKGTNTATYSLTCTNVVYSSTANAQTAGAQCSVQVNTPSIVLVANPKTVQSGATSQIGWVTSGMQSCVISS